LEESTEFQGHAECGGGQGRIARIRRIGRIKRLMARGYQNGGAKDLAE